MGTFAEQIPRLVFDGPGMGNMGGLNWRPEGHEDHMLTSHLPETNNGWDINGCRSGRSICPGSFSREPRPHDGDIGKQKRRQEEPADICCVLKSRDALDRRRKEGCYQFMGHKVWAHEILRIRCLQTGTVTVDLKR